MPLPDISKPSFRFVLIVGMVNLFVAGIVAGTAKAGHLITRGKNAMQLYGDF